MENETTLTKTPAIWAGLDTRAGYFLTRLNPDGQTKRIVARFDNESTVAEQTELLRACNGYAALMDFADLVDRLSVQMRCQIAGTSHMDPNDKRIPVMTGQLDKDLVQLQARARELLNP